MSDYRFDAFVSLFDQLRGRRHALRIAASGLLALRVGTALEPVAAKKKKRKHKRKKKHREPSLAERCVASCDATCENCWVQPNNSLICGEGIFIGEVQIPCTSNAECNDPDYPSCLTGYVVRETGEFFEDFDGDSACAKVMPCQA